MLNQLKPKHKTKNRKRVARGGKRGTYAGRGCKGQKSRSGNNKEPIIRGWIKKYPKLRGYRFNARPKNYLEVNFDILEKEFKAKEKVNPSTLLKKGIIRKIKKRIPRVKILGRGKITKALIVVSCEVSKIAKEKIEKAGGSVIEKSLPTGEAGKARLAKNNESRQARLAKNNESRQARLAKNNESRQARLAKDSKSKPIKKSETKKGNPKQKVKTEK